MYDVRDLIKKAIAITMKKRRLYEGILENTPDPRARILIQILIKQVDKDLKFYEDLNLSLEGLSIDPIDFGIYDTISSLINQFGRKLLVPKIKTRREMLHFAIETEKSIYALMVDIQGRLTQAESSVTSTTYITMGRAIEQKRMVIQNLENFEVEG